VLLVVIGVTAGVTLFVVVLIQLMGRAPSDQHTFGNDEAMTVHVDAGASKTIYLRTLSGGDERCTASPDAGQRKPELSPYSAKVTLKNWRALFTLSVQDGGDYTIRCSGPADARYGVGEHISARDIAYPFIAIGAAAPVVIGGIVVLIVTFVRRRRSPFA
jgi:hypothetical protein